MIYQHHVAKTLGMFCSPEYIPIIMYPYIHINICMDYSEIIVVVRKLDINFKQKALRPLIVCACPEIF